MRTNTVYLCDTCGRLAETFAIDVIENPQDNPLSNSYNEWRAFIPVGEIKSGCFLHPVESKKI